MVANQVGGAKHVNPLLVNGWGLAFGPGSPFWIRDAGCGWSTPYNGTGLKQALNVLVPTAGGDGPGTPTGIVFNGSTPGAVYTGLAITSHTSGNFLFAADNAVLCIIRDQQRVAERSEFLGRTAKPQGRFSGAPCAKRLRNNPASL